MYVNYMDNDLQKFKRRYNLKVRKNHNKDYKIEVVADMFKIKKNLSINQKCLEIIKYLKDNSEKNQKIKFLLDNFRGDDICTVLSNILYDMFSSDNLKDININLTDKRYRNLIKKYEKNNLNDIEMNLLMEALNIKYCKCVKKLYLKNLFEKDIMSKEETYNPYAVCINSIYKNRKIVPPKKISYSCREKYDWYK